MRRSALGALAWVAGGGLSAWATWQGWRGPEPNQSPPTPPALDRVPSGAELAELRSTAAVFQRALDEAARARGAPVPTGEIEGSGPDGLPLVEGGIPDNPLVPGVGLLIERCPPRVAAGELAADWLYCPRTGEVAPVLPYSAVENR